LGALPLLPFAVAAGTVVTSSSKVFMLIGRSLFPPPGVARRILH
jgi:hypothetical protein